MFERVKLVTKKTHMAQEKAHLDEVTGLNETSRQQRNQGVQRVSELLSKLSETELARSEADERTRMAEETCAQVVACHAGRVRAGSIPVFDVIEMTSRIRNVEGSLRCEPSPDGKKIVAYGDYQLTEAQWNALVETGTPKWDRT